MNILDKTFLPLNDDELKSFQSRYTRDFTTMNIDDAISLFKMILPLGGRSNTDDYYYNLLMRRLHEIIDWTNHPERLL